jgi:vitamin K-dependent gamma-carboxylase
MTATAAPDVDIAGAAPGLWSPGVVTRAALPVSAASTAVARITFGLLVAYSSIRFWHNGWIDTLYLAPDHHLTYRGFEWVRPLPAGWMHAAVWLMALCGIAIAVGYRTRVAAICFAVVFCYCELIDAALYLNHYVYVTMAALLMAALPVGSMWSLDARAGRVTPSATVPAVVVWLLRLQLAIVYLFAGLAKLNPDWLFEAMPLRLWLADRTDVPVVGPWLDEPAVAYAASWAGAVFDLTIVWLLLWRRTRRVAYLAVIAFHVSTMMFRIGVFPWVMILSTPIFFRADWPLRFTGRYGGAGSPRRLATGSPLPRRSLLAAAVVAWVVLQVAIPARHYVIPGDVRWTEEGYYGSYRVMLNEKVGWYEFTVTDGDTGSTWRVDPGLVLTGWQEKQAAARADLLLASAHLVADYYEARGIDVEVRADSWVSLNGRPREPLVDPAIDLAAVSRWAPSSSYLLPSDRRGAP